VLNLKKSINYNNIHRTGVIFTSKLEHPQREDSAIETPRPEGSALQNGM
jgi:hypothetical protein